MSKENDKAKKVFGISEDGVEKFADGVQSSQRMIMRKVNAVIASLEVQNGLIKINRDNLRLLRNLQEELSKIVITPAYKKKLDTYLRNFDRIKRVNDGYFLDVLPKFNPKKQAFTTIINSSIELTANSLGKAGIDNAVIRPILDIIQQGITSGSSIADMQESLTIEILGDPDGTLTGTPRQGKMLRYTKQITRDALNQFSRNYLNSVSNEYGLQWYYYQGSIIQDTRDYCKKRAGKYFHKKEVQKSANEKWAGKIPSTTKSSIFVYAGGYSCRHEFVPVLIDVVPKSVIRRNERNGNYKPS